MLSTQLLTFSLIICCNVAVFAQVPTYLNPKYVYTGLPSTSSLSSSATVQTLLARQLANAAFNSPKRSLATYGTSTISSPSRYTTVASASNPSIVAIPLYVRNNQAQKPALFDLISSSHDHQISKKTSISPKYISYINSKKSPAASTNIESSIPYRSSSSASPSESIGQYEKQTYASYSKYNDAPKASPSNYEPVRSYELKSSEPGYGDASSVSLLSTSYSYNPTASASRQQASSAPSGYAGVAQNPRLKAVEYDDNQKSALADFASALENFDLKAISNQDIYDLPPINPPLTRIPVKPKQDSRSQVSSQDDSYAPTRSQGPSSYSSPAAASSAYDESRSYSSNSGSSYSPSEYAASDYASPQENSYRPSATETYRSPANAYRASSGSGYSDDSRDSYRASSSQGDSYRASSTSDSYTGSQSGSYVPAPSSYGETSYASSSDAYSSRPSSSYASSSSDYYTDSSNPTRSNQDDPNCPYKLAASSSSNSGSTAEYASSPVSSSATSVSSSSPVSTSSAKFTSSSNIKDTSAYETDELDPSKLDLKVVHLPVSVLKRLVGNGELALPSFNKKK